MDSNLPVAVDLDAPREPVRRVEYAHGDDAHNAVDRAVAALEDELTLTKYAPPAHRSSTPEPLPDYIEPREGVPAIGAISAEAIVREFEKTAKGIEAMSADLNEAARHCANELIELTEKYKIMAEDIERVVAHINETAAGYREEAKMVFLRIEDTTLRMQEVRQLSEDMRERLVTPGIGDAQIKT